MPTDDFLPPSNSSFSSQKLSTTLASLTFDFYALKDELDKTKSLLSDLQVKLRLTEELFDDAIIVKESYRKFIDCSDQEVKDGLFSREEMLRWARNRDDALSKSAQKHYYGDSELSYT